MEEKLTEKVDRLEMALMRLEALVERIVEERERSQREFEERQERARREFEQRQEMSQRDFEERQERARKEFEDRWTKGMEEFRQEMREMVRERNKEWGRIANKMGTIVEDIIYPALRPVIRKYFQCEPEKMAVRLVYSDRDAGIHEEFDAVALCEDTLFLLEVKTTPREKHIQELKAKAERFRLYFPEFVRDRTVLIMGSLRFEDSFVKELSKAGIYAMAYREWEYMDILNFDEVGG